MRRCFLFYELLIVLIILCKKAYVTFIIKNLNEVFFFNSQIKHCLGLRERGNPDGPSSVKFSLTPKTGLTMPRLGPLGARRGFFGEPRCLPPFLRASESPGGPEVLGPVS